MPDRPNVLVLMTDEHRPGVLGFAGDDVARTPTLDHLAETGVVFENAYTPAPSCVPARQSLRTGKLPRTWGQDGMDAFEDPEYRTLPLQFARHGYMTASGGKEHYRGWNQHVGWRKRLGPTPMKQHGIGSGQVPDPAPSAFEGEKNLGDWKWSDATEIKRAGVGESRTQVQDRRVVEGVEQYVREFSSSPYYDRAQPDTPLLLKTSLIEPHYPFFVPDEDRFTYYLNRVDPFVEGPGDFHPVLSSGHTVVPAEDVSERDLRRVTAAYYAMVEHVDDLFGRVLDALRENGEDLDKWMIVFTADHGEMLGERGLWQKSQFWEPSVGVPLVVRWPAAFEPHTVEANVSLCDLYATLCDLADVPVPSGLDSRSLRPLLEGNTATWHDHHGDEVVSQNVGNGALTGDIESQDLMIKREDLKYCFYGEEVPEVLFDLDRDPGETTNHIDDPAYADAVEQFRQRRAELGYGPDGDPDYDTAGYDPGTDVEGQA